MNIVLDAGALIALDRNDRAMWKTYASARRDGARLISHGGVVGQAWRTGGPRQATLARALAGVDIRPLDDDLGRSAGALLARVRRGDVIDAAVVLLASDGDLIITSDVGDLLPLVDATGRDVELVRV